MDLVSSSYIVDGKLSEFDVKVCFFLNQHTVCIKVKYFNDLSKVTQSFIIFHILILEKKC